VVRVTDWRPERSVLAAHTEAPGGLPAGGQAAAQAATQATRHTAAADSLDVERSSELAWLVLWLACVVAIVVFPAWQIIPFDLIWISLALLYGFKLWPSRRTLALIATAVATTAAAIGDDAIRHLHFAEPVEQIPLLATMVVAMAWQAHRRVLIADRAKIAAEAERLLGVQRQFLQDASHQLRSPITIALGHAELLAAELAGRQHQRDINIVVGELERLRTLSDRLLLVAASQNPDFLRPELTDLDLLAAELLRRWLPTAPRQWQLGRIEPIKAYVDAERLALALDALVENAVRHTGPEDVIRISVLGADAGQVARIVVEDTGEGIDEAHVPHIFDRFRTAVASGTRGTGLGLALVQAIARGHGGDVRVHSVLGQGSRFEVLLPAASQPIGITRALDWESARTRAGGGVHREAW
jgi:signal transduction histidine kinase